MDCFLKVNNIIMGRPVCHKSRPALCLQLTDPVNAIYDAEAGAIVPAYINALYPLLGIVVIALLSLVAFPYLFHKPLKKTLCATGIWAHYLGFLLKTEGGILPLSVAWRLFLEQDFSRSIQVAGLSIWILVMLAVAWQIIVAIYRTVRFLVKR